MKKFFYLSCSISAIVIALCALSFTVYMFIPKKKTFNVDIEGKRNYITYRITGNLPEEKVTPFVKKKTDELKNESSKPNTNYRRF